MNSIQQISRAIGILLLATFLVVALAATLVLATDFILLIFLGILFGVFLTQTSQLLGKWVPFLDQRYGWNLGIVTFVLLAVIIGAMTLFGVKIEQRLDGMSKQLDESGAKLDEWLSDRPFARRAFEKIPFAGEILDNHDGNPDSKPKPETEPDSETKPEPKTDSDTEPDSDDNDSKNEHSQENQSHLSGQMMQQTAGRVFSVFQRMVGTTLGLLANIGVIFFVGIFIAVNPPLYRDGFAKLFPFENRERVTEVMNKMGVTMFGWLNGRFLAMLFTGGGTAIALLLLGVPMAITIGVITGMLTFIPNIGGIMALMLAAAMALTQGPMILLWVVVAYALLQLVESNIVTPLIQQQKTSIPPALLIGFQVILGAMTGFLGLLVATPFLAAMLVLVQELWIKDVLGDE